MKSDITTFLEDIRNGLYQWFEAAAKDLEPGRFRFCSQGALVPLKGKVAHMSTCFAMKAAWQSGIWDLWLSSRREGCIEFVQSFQREDGFFFDPWLERNSRIGFRSLLGLLRGDFSLKELSGMKRLNLRAETRQSTATLLMVGRNPSFAAPLEFNDIMELRRFLSSLDWTRPWAAASHVSHLLFFLSLSKRCFDLPSDYDDMVEVIGRFLEGIHDKKTGCWFLGKPSDDHKINGAMKVLSGLQWLGKRYPDLTSLVDFALEQPFLLDGCGFINRLFVIQQALKGVENGYRHEDVSELAMQALHHVSRFRRGDGGFSFYPDCSQRSYYGVRASLGLQVGDLHGAAMITWAIATAFDLLGNSAPQTSALWKCHNP